MGPSRRPIGCALLLALATWAGHASAVGTRVFELDTLEKLSGGELKGTSVSSDGVVRAGFTLGNVPFGHTSAVWSVVPLGDGSVLVGVTDGRVFRVANYQSTLFADTKSAA